MSKHHTLEEKQEILRLHEAGVSMVELMTRFHVSDHYLYILFGRYKKYGFSGLENYKKAVVSFELKEQIIQEYEVDCLPLWQLCVKYDVSHSSVCRWIQQYKSGGYEELHRHHQRGRPSRHMGRPKKKEPQTELEKLQAENLRLRAENALLKKAKALMEEERVKSKDSGLKSSIH
ncbi:helix-turn-helix domain-containing protein [Parabacteroides sp. AM08-6]|uniref:helix-turn-helix domain-containing protein n=1 Tax=Parabacteroides sp. AM08-6 TaxID=2292053 RepID=UPI000EFF50B6|nr:helix-turn-helix domain-containing protein [Parabacteroides sp. AM08-6]RHJ83894.1 transposase [Parabacteroides sp. AM08-6]